MGMLAVLGGGFGIGLWYIVARGDAKLALKNHNISKADVLFVL